MAEKVRIKVDDEGRFVSVVDAPGKDTRLIHASQLADLQSGKFRLEGHILVKCAPVAPVSQAE